MQAPAQPRSRPITPQMISTLTERLDERERAWAGNVGRRLRAEFGALVNALPAHERNGPGLERLLGTNRAGAYRLLSALAATDELEVLTRIPGIEGLRKCIASARRKLDGEVETLLAGAEAAINDFNELIRAAGGSHTRLVARIHATTSDLLARTDPTPPGRRDDVRRAMHDVIRVLSGRVVASRMSVSIVKPSANPKQLEYAHARAYIGYRPDAGGLPLVLASWVSQPDNTTGPIATFRFQNLRGQHIEGRDSSGLIAEFSSLPLPVVTARDTAGRLMQFIDCAGAAPESPIDAALGYRLDNVGPPPSEEDPPIFLEALNISVPAENLVADLYVHRSLMHGATPSLNLYLGKSNGGCDLIDRWHEQIHGAPILGLLGPGIANAHAAAWTRHAEFTRHAFSQTGWDPAEFVGFRCEERWPLWNCDYVFALDYRVSPPQP
jgi:hypothetical protein